MKIDRNGFGYYDKLPDGFREATIDDFLSNGKRKIDMEFLIKWSSGEYYQICNPEFQFGQFPGIKTLSH